MELPGYDAREGGGVSILSCRHITPAGWRSHGTCVVVAQNLMVIGSVVYVWELAGRWFLVQDGCALLG